MDILSKLKANPSNPRTISKDQFEKLKTSIRNFPQMLELRPIVYDDEYIVQGGNMRLKAINELVKSGFEVKESYFIKAENLTPEQLKEFAIKDNIPAGDWDMDVLVDEWSDLPLDEWGLELDGLTDEKEIEEDEAPAVSNEEPESKLGEIYQLGRHRLMCGDSTDAGSVALLMNGGNADMVFTDPPYNVDYVGKTKNALKIQNDKFEGEGFYQFLFDAFSNIAAVVKSGAAMYVCHADSEGLNFRKAFVDAGFLLKQCIVWNKNSMVMGRQDYQWKHEPILYGWKDGGSHKWYGDRSQTTVWDIDRPSRSEEHPTMKPIALIDRALKNSSKSGDIILDIFGGSGSTLIACEQTNRTCYMMELDPKYCDVIRKRYWKLINGTEEGWQDGTNN